MVLRGEKTAWLVILACTAAIAALLLWSGRHSQSQAIQTPSFLNRVPASVVANEPEIASQPKAEVRLQNLGKGRVQSMTIIKARVDADTANSVREAQARLNRNGTRRRVDGSELTSPLTNEAKDATQTNKQFRRLAGLRSSSAVDMLSTWARLTPPSSSSDRDASVGTEPTPARNTTVKVKVIYSDSSLLEGAQLITAAVIKDIDGMMTGATFVSVTYDEVDKVRTRLASDYKALYQVDFVYAFSERAGLVLLTEP